MNKLSKQQLSEIVNICIDKQKMLYNRLQNETDTESRNWTAMQIAYQKRVYKKATSSDSGCVVDGIKPVTYKELLEYYNQVVNS